jgi:Protein of unknown function, DUF481
MPVKFLASSLIVLTTFAFSGNCFASQPLQKLKEKKVAHKNDVVVMDNSDRMTGEIKKMEFGVLYLKSDRVADTLRLDWKRVANVQSGIRYEFELKNRQFYIGTIAVNPEGIIPSGELTLTLDDGSSLHAKISEIIGIREMQRAFLGRLNLALDAGISFTSANHHTQTTVNAAISFQKPKYSGSLNVSSLFSGENGSLNTSRHEMKLAASRVLNRKWELSSLLSLLKDNQQELDLRTTVGGGLERMFVKSNRTLFSGLIGVVYTNENYFPSAESDRNNAEALTGLTFSTYRFRGSELNTSLFVFPSLSNAGRVRADLYVDWKWDIVSDLYWKVGVTNNYDSRPPSSGINNNLSVTSSVGWSF